MRNRVIIGPGMMQTVTSEQLYVLSLACSMVSPDIKGVWPHGAMPTAYIFVPKLSTDQVIITDCQ